MHSPVPFLMNDVFYCYEASVPDDRNGRQHLSNLRTIFRKHLLPNILDNPEQFEGFKDKNLMVALSTLSLHDFMATNPEVVLMEASEKAVQSGEIKPSSTRTTYLPALRKFLKFLSKQTWYNVVVADATCRYSPKVEARVCKAKTRKGRRSHRENPYGLLEEQLTDKLKLELLELEIFCTAKEVSERRDRPMRINSFRSNIRRSTLLYWGYLHNIKGIPLQDLSIDLLLRDGVNTESENFRLFKDFVSWGINTRGNKYGWAMTMTKAPLSVAKWKYAHLSKRTMYRDISVVEEIRAYLNRMAAQYDDQKTINAAEKEEKEMTMEQCIEVVNFLRQCCAPRRANHCKRSDMAVMQSYLRYLLVAIFTYCPIRQREVRELSLGRTLFREDGYRVILSPDDNKTYAHRDFRLADMLPPQVIKDLDYWLDHWRPWFLDKVKKDAQTQASWLASMGYTETGLKTEIQALQTEIQSGLKAGKDDDSLKKQMKKLRKLLRIQASWERVQEALTGNYVFFLVGGTTGRESRGQPYMRENMRDIVVTAVYNATYQLIELKHPLFEGVNPKYTNPHFFRNIATTHERRYGDPRKREAFHNVLGNSVKEGDRTYNEMRPAEKSAAAAGWWKTSQQQQPDLEMQVFLASLTPEQREKLKKLL